ncbi:hypothetical protein MIR68_005569 [Amoeboaphelidium protococcarum]|nr:hypothetical protein MIR68_005569 [Amoeboaphelidium protococcarum]
MDLIMTISDAEDTPHASTDLHSDAEQKEVEQQNKPQDINPNFSFTMNDSDMLGKMMGLSQAGKSSWDFGTVKEHIKRKYTEVDIDETIARQLSDVDDASDQDSDASVGDSESEDGDDSGSDEDGEDIDSAFKHQDTIEGKFSKLQDKVVDKKVAEYFEQPDIVSDAGGDDEQNYAQTFTEMNLSRPLLKGLADLGFNKPTKIQAMTIPLALMGRDICGAAQTGSGKSAAFLLPILERLLYKPKGHGYSTAATRVLILTPTRELAAQCYSVAVKLAKYTDITFSLCVGGTSSQQQEVELKKRPDIVFATPGRLVDHLMNSASFEIDMVDILVMDEADRMLEEGFQAELTEIIKQCPRNCQRLLFSATMTDNVDQLVQLSLHRPVRLFIDSVNAVASNLVQEFIRIRNVGGKSVSDNGDGNEAGTSNGAVDHATLPQREAILLALCQRTYRKRVIVFMPSKILCHRMKVIFGLSGLKATELHGNLSQMQRIESLERFRDCKVDFLLCTDIASRGLDIAGIEVVINLQMPPSYERYVHRVGRTARNNKHGKSVTLVGERERKMVKTVLKNLKPGQVAKQRVLPAEVVKKYREQIQSLEEKISTVLTEEKQEKQIKIAEMQLKKGENLIKHADEIAARPAKLFVNKNIGNNQSGQRGGGNKSAASSGKSHGKHQQNRDKKQKVKRYD